MSKPARTDSSESTSPKIFVRPEDLLPRVQRPARYIGHEVNSVRKDQSGIKLRMALAFPDVYEVGMSHLGLKILYSIVNRRPDLSAERVFAVWPDMERLMRENQVPLSSLESGTRLSEFDVVGFSLQYELCATTVLQMLDLGGIPLRAEDRESGDPLVIGGGPAAFNPAPLEPFFDAFALGDGEELILELAETVIRWKREGGSREELLAAWKGLPGVYVPSLHGDGDVVSRRILADLNRADFPTGLVVPFCETVHDRVGLEIARGCTRGCRFCQAGMLYRPVRERNTETIAELARKSLEITGWEEVALLSLSSGDYSCIGELVRHMTREFGADKVALSLPSLRTETFDAGFAEHIRKVRKTGFTLAPEAGTERLRRVVNKGNTEEDLERAVSAAFEAGWRSVKLYFMIGLPGETDEDLDGIVDLIRKASAFGKGGKITASISTFVPKSHTPFQWAGQLSTEETTRRQHYIRRSFQRGRARVKFHDPRTSFLEGVIARADGNLADAIELAFRYGARFDGWEEHLKLDTWMKAFEETGIDPERYLGPRSTAEKLPWDFINTGVTRDYLLCEWEKALTGQTTGDCRFGDCEGCGVCDFEEILPRKAEPTAMEFRRLPGDEAEGEETEVRRYRLRYAKTGLMRFLGHRDLIRVFSRAFRRAGMKLAYSKGFHPHPRLKFSPPLSVGVESVAEYLDFELVGSKGGAETISPSLEKNLPHGVTMLELSEIPLNDPPVSAKIQQFTYEISEFGSLSPEEIGQRVGQFHSSEVFPITLERKGKTRTRDLKTAVENLQFAGSSLTMTLKADPSHFVNPLEAAAAILGTNREHVRGMKVLKRSVGLISSRGKDRGSSHE